MCQVKLGRDTNTNAIVTFKSHVMFCLGTFVFKLKLPPCIQKYRKHNLYSLRPRSWSNFSISPDSNRGLWFYI